MNKLNEIIENECYAPTDLADPREHALHHTMCWKDRDRFDDDLEKMKQVIVDLESQIEALTKSLTNLVAMFNLVRAESIQSLT